MTRTAMFMGMIVFLAACDAETPRPVPRAEQLTQHGVRFLERFDFDRQQASHPAEDLLKEFLKDLIAIAYGQGKLEWVNGRTLSLEHPFGFEADSKDIAAWKKLAPRVAYAKKYDFSGDFARVAWLVQGPTGDDVFSIYLAYRDGRWLLVGYALGRGSGGSWKEFYRQQAVRLEVGRQTIWRGPAEKIQYRDEYTDENLLSLVEKAEKFCRWDGGMIPVGLWCELLYSDSVNIRDYALSRISEKCGIVAKPLADRIGFDAWISNIGKQLMERYPEVLRDGFPESSAEVPMFWRRKREKDR